MLASPWVNVHAVVSLAVVVAILGGGVALSLLRTRRAVRRAPTI
jgi:predicted membrane-bound mannosyltransferase